MISEPLRGSDARNLWFGMIPKSWSILRNKNAFRLVNKKVGSSWKDGREISQ